MSVAVVLAAGLGTRMRSPLAKVLHPLLGRSMVGWIVRACEDAGATPIVVVNHQAEAVQAALAGSEASFARQSAPLGTGDALRAALPLLPASGPVLVTAGDTPLLTAASLRRLLDAHRAHGGASTVATFHVADPTGYGRIVTDGGLRIVEQVECTPEQAAIRQVNSGVYVFEAGYLRDRLPTLAPHGQKGEYYLTDLVTRDTVVADGFDADEFMGVNDRAALADARRVLRRRVNRAWALAGVDFADLEAASVDVDCVLRPDAHIGFGAVVEGRSDIGGSIGTHSVVRDSVVEAGAAVKEHSVLEAAHVCAGAVVGPFARLRPGAVIEPDAHIGNFVEVKNARVRRGAKANHLAYLGDADVGERANIGAGTITCNYDGFGKYRTDIGAGAFIGSNTALVAPVRVGDNAIIGAGSTITEDVPAEAVAIARGAQVTKPDLAPKIRGRAKARKELMIQRDKA